MKSEIGLFISAYIAIRRFKILGLLHRFFLFVVLLVSFHPPSVGQITSDLKFKRYSIEEGLSQVSIGCMLQDKKGYIWIGTYDGLNRFDGYTFTNFRHNQQDNTSLSNNYVTSIFEDSQNKIWIGTRGGLNLFDPKSQTFSHYQHEPNNPTSLSHNEVNSIFQDSKNRIWVGTEEGLNLLNIHTSEFTHFQRDPDNPTSLSHNSVQSILQDRQNRIWIGTRGGLNLFNPQTRTFTHLQHAPNNRASLSNNNVQSIFQDRQNRIWIGTRGGGLNLFDTQTQTFTHFQHDANNPASLSNNDVISVLQDQQNKIWVGTIGGGLNIWDPQTQVFSHFKHDPNNPHSLSNNSVWSIMQDRQNKIWIGTLGDGLNLFDPHLLAFSHFNHDPNDLVSLSNNSIWSIFQDRQGSLWVGTDAGLNLLSPQTGAFSHFKHDPNNPLTLSNDHVVSIFQDRQNRIWVGTYAGLNLLDSQTGTFSHFQHDPNNPTSLSHNKVRSIFQDRQNRFWVGTLGGGLNLFNPQTKVFTHFQHDANNPTSLSNNRIRIIYEDQQDRIWVGTDGGINLLDVQTQTFNHFYHDPNNPNSLSNDNVQSIFQNRRGRLWIGTYGGGINLFEPETSKFKSWGKNEGISSDLVYGILEDSKGNLWLSTSKGINKFNPETEKFTSYDQQDGLQSEDFNGGAYHIGKDGKMYFGGVGFTTFYPNSIKDNTHIPPVVITEFLLVNKPVAISDTTVLRQAADYTKEIILAHDDYIFAFEFSALNYRQPEKNQFAYKLEGFNEDWIYTDYKDRKATYTNVPAGSYTFRVKASNDDGYWNEEGASVKVIILPPWWLTWWAKMIWVSLFVSLLFGTYRLRVAELKKQKKRLEVKVKTRTQEVVQQKEEIQAQAEELIAQSEELKTSNEQLEKSYAQLQELDEYKEATTAMIVHDFKNSLNTIISFSDGTPNARRIKSIKNAGRHMLNLALNMLDVQKFEQVEVPLALADNAIPKLINEALEEVRFLMEQKSLKLTHKLDDNLYANCDLELITRVITNILTNAIKYTSANGTINIQAEIQNEFVKLSVNDTGQGIPKGKLQRIFEKFAQVERKQSGEVRSTGLGLTFCKMVVEAHGGEIAVESEEGKGSTFWFTIQKAKTPQGIKEEKVEINLDVPSETVLELNEKDKAILEPYMKQLKQCEVYDYSDVQEVISSIEANGNPAISSWLEEMNKAVQNVNEERYNELVNGLD